MTRYMPITGIDCTIPSLLIDTEAPVDVLHDTAAYRIRSVTQLLESLSLGEALGVMLRCCKSLRGCWPSRCVMAAICWMWSGGGCERSFKSTIKMGDPR